MSEKKSRFTPPSVVSIVAAVVMIVLLVLQFTPFWAYTDKDDAAQKISISEFIWFPTEHKDVQKYFAAETGVKKFNINSMVLPPVLVLLTGFVGVILCLLTSNSPAGGLLAIACGVSGVWGYLGIPVMKLGTNWALHLAFSFVVLAAGIALLVYQIMQIRKAKVAA